MTIFKGTQNEFDSVEFHNHISYNILINQTMNRRKIIIIFSLHTSICRYGVDIEDGISSTDEILNYWDWM